MGLGNERKVIIDFWPGFLESNWGREFVAGGIGGTAGIISGYPLDTIHILQQSAFTILRNVVAKSGPASLYRGMAAPLASLTFQALKLPRCLNGKGYSLAQ